VENSPPKSLASLLKTPQLSTLITTFQDHFFRPLENDPVDELRNALKNCKQLTNLQLSNSTPVSDALLENLPSSLMELNLDHFTDLKPLIDFLQTKSCRLANLDLYSRDKSADSSVELLGQALPLCLSLRKLSLSIGFRLDLGASAIFSSLPKTKLTYLKLASLSDSFNLDRFASCVAEAPSLTHLELRQSTANIIPAVGFVSILSRTQLRSLTLDGVFLGPEGGLALTKELPKSSIRELVLSFLRLDDETFKALALALPQSSVNKFAIKNGRFSKYTTNVLFKVLKDTQIQSLLVSGSVVDGEAVASALPDCPLLQTLDLDLCEIENSGIVAIGRVLAQTNLVYLNLLGNKVEHDGALSIINGLKGSKVRHLKFDCGLNSYAQPTDAEVKTAQVLGALENVLSEPDCCLSTFYPGEAHCAFEFRDDLRSLLDRHRVFYGSLFFAF
jgi:hypothetical protein